MGDSDVIIALSCNAKTRAFEGGNDVVTVLDLSVLYVVRQEISNDFTGIIPFKGLLSTQF